jgi:HSP20 family protein
MKTNNNNYPKELSTYPGTFVPSPLVLEELVAELQQPHEGESRPLVNVVEESDAFIIDVAAPGLKSEDFNVGIQEDILTISVLHKEKEESNKLFHQHEFNYWCFKRDIILPQNVDADFLSAFYENGILRVRIPKSNVAIMNNVERVIIY